MRKSGSFYPVLLLLGWTGLIAAGTFAMLETTVRQYLSKDDATTQGKIVRSQVDRGPFSNRGVDIEYNYVVNGIEYTGHRFRYDDNNITFEWNATVELHPRWSLQKVYYNPDNPADSLLQPGIDGSDLLILLFVLPMDILTCGLWGATWRRWREKSHIPPAGGVRIVKKAGETRISLERTSALAAGFYGLAAAAFLASFPALIAGGSAPQPRFVEETWVIVFAAGVIFSIWWALRNQSGVYDLRVNQTAQTVTLPKVAGVPAPLTIARSDIVGVSMHRRVSKGPSGTLYSYLPALIRNGSGTHCQSIKLVGLGWSQEKAGAFGQWLSQELGVEFKGVEEEVADTLVKS